jgi:hypothetical protein
MQFYCQNTIRPTKDTKLCLRVEKWSRVGITSFLNFYTKLAESSFLCRFRIESVNVFVLPRFDLCHVLSSSANNFTHAQTLSRMSSLSGRMNIARVNIGFFTGFKKIKRRRISFVLDYLRMILWKSSILTACMTLRRRGHVFLLGISILPLHAVFRLNFGPVPTVSFFTLFYSPLH